MWFLMTALIALFANVVDLFAPRGARLSKTVSRSAQHFYFYLMNARSTRRDRREQQPRYRTS